MSWTSTKWAAFCTLIEEAWPGEFDDTARKAWRILLDDLAPEVAGMALKRLLNEGNRFRPAAAEFLAAARRDPSVPTFDECFLLIYGRRGVVRSAICGDAAREVHPLVRSFAERQGIERLSRLPVDDPEWGEKTRRDLEAAWDRHREAFEGREVAAIASGVRDGLRQLDPLSEIRPPRPSLTEAS